MEPLALVKSLEFLRAPEVASDKAVCKAWATAARHALTRGGRWHCIRLTLDALREHAPSLVPDPSAGWTSPQNERRYECFDEAAPFLPHFRDAWALDAALVISEITTANEIVCPRTAAGVFLAAVEPRCSDYDAIKRVVKALEHAPIEMLTTEARVSRSDPIYGNWQRRAPGNKYEYGEYHYLPLISALEQWRDTTKAGTFYAHTHAAFGTEGDIVGGNMDRRRAKRAMEEGWRDREGKFHEGWTDQSKMTLVLASLDIETTRMEAVVEQHLVQLQQRIEELRREEHERQAMSQFDKNG